MAPVDGPDRELVLGQLDDERHDQVVVRRRVAERLAGVALVASVRCGRSRSGGGRRRSPPVPRRRPPRSPRRWPGRRATQSWWRTPSSSSTSTTGGPSGAAPPTGPEASERPQMGERLAPVAVSRSSGRSSAWAGSPRGGGRRSPSSSEPERADDPVELVRRRAWSCGRGRTPGRSSGRRIPSACHAGQQLGRHLVAVEPGPQVGLGQLEVHRVGGVRERPAGMRSGGSMMS